MVSERQASVVGSIELKDLGVAREIGHPVIEQMLDRYQASGLISDDSEISRQMDIFDSFQRLFGDAVVTIYECRDCGNALDSEEQPCPECGSTEVASYRL